jgi:signal transduction histidine kinase
MKNLLAGVENVLKLATREPKGIQARVQRLLLDAQLNCEAMGEMLGDVLDLYALRRDGPSAVVAEVNLILVVEKCVRLLKFMAEEKNITLRVVLPERPPKVLLDEQRFTRVLLNLLHNAMKFSPPGKRVELDVCVEGRGSVVITVTDYGKGIGRQHARSLSLAGHTPRVAARDEQTTGYGIGLQYCRAAIPSMGGELWVESPPSGAETGSRFGLRLPLLRGDEL